jgi:hypothetical protein
VIKFRPGRGLYGRGLRARRVMFSEKVNRTRSNRMYIYTVQAMPGFKAKFDGDPSINYRVRRTNTSPSAKDKSRTDVIRTELGFTEATELVKRFNDKEHDARAVRNEAASRLAPNV